MILPKNSMQRFLISLFSGFDGDFGGCNALRKARF